MGGMSPNFTAAARLGWHVNGRTQMNQKRAVIALDVGGTKTSCGLFLDDGQILFQKTVATCQRDPDASVDQLEALTCELIGVTPKDVVAAALGIVIPGWVDHKTRTVWAPNIQGWNHLPLESRLAERLPIPIVLDSDRSAYVKGEAWRGIACGLKDVIFLAVGTGIGAGILIDGKVIHGSNDLAGAVGWFALNPHFKDLYASMGCFEGEASANSVGRKGAGPPVGLKPGPAGAITAREVMEAARSAYPPAEALMNEAILYLSMGVANLVSALDPEMIVLGGGLFQNGTWLLDRIRAEFARWAQPIAAQRVRIELSRLGEYAGLYGAARIAFDNI
jgi:glucokinase